MYTVIRHPTKDGWTYRFDRWWETKRAIQRRTPYPTAIAVMIYLVREIGVPWQEIVWNWGTLPSSHNTTEQIALEGTQQ